MTWTATDASGNGATDQQRISVNVPTPIRITVTSPGDGGSVIGPRAVVTGIVQTPQPNVGVIVNGVIASLDRTATPMTFRAAVPLVAGANTLTVVGTGQGGDTDTQSLTVTRLTLAGGDPDAYTVRAEPAAGLAPLVVNFEVDATTGAGSIFSIHLDVDGDGVMDQEILEPIITPLGDVLLKPLTVPRILTHTYSAPGIYTAAVWLNRRSITGAPDTGIRFDVVIDVFDEPAMDALFTQMWDGMNSALVAGDVNGALGYVLPGSREKYQPVFQTLLPSFPAIIASYSPFRRTWMSSGLSEYSIIRQNGGKNMLFLIYFILDDQGI